MKYKTIAETTEATVVAEYIPEKRTDTAYQNEDKLEREFIKSLTEQGYDYIKIKDEKELIANLRHRMEELNNYKFSDNEWKSFYSNIISNSNDGILEKTRKIQDDYIQNLTCDNGETKNIKLIDKKNIHNNYLQVLNQYEEDNGAHQTRYDVTILVNGLPLIHVELKRRGVAIREAFNQIKRYQRDSFWTGCALYEYVQIFIISNGTHTKYYSNTTRDRHVKEFEQKISSKKKKTSNSFEFTSYWADEANNIITDLVDFTKTFLAKHTILNILTRYCVFTSEDALLVMRPYQIVATEKIINRIKISTTYKKTGTLEAGGYIWHTTGSGKTLTSFKTAQLATSIDGIDKVLFVVDRKDLDYQTMREYDRFEKGAANSNKSTKILQKQLEDPNVKIIITTIQKLSVFISKNKEHEIYKKHIVIVFDECHRSQFGDMHVQITKSFKNYHIFGFTGTPIFSVNSGSGKNVNLKTTEQAFGDRLHTYTIVDAISDGNVLPFKIDYNNTIAKSDIMNDKKVKAIDKENALLDDRRIAEITKYILEHFDQKTYRNQGKSFYNYKVITNVEEMAKSKNNTASEIKEDRKINGFNSIFAVASIPMAIKYYTEFKNQMSETGKGLRVATIFSYSPNEEDPEDSLYEENFETDELDQTSRDFLDGAIDDYNGMFGTSYDTSPDKFQNYYKDLSLRMKNREIDILIVVNMFLTGFDATTLNTLWVDKNLKYHGLIQAFSRTNRILNSIKVFGNIVCFRNLNEEVEKALSLFGNKDASGIVILKTYEEYLNGYEEKGKHVEGYKEVISNLENLYPLEVELITEKDRKGFIKLFGKVLKLRNILNSFDEFCGNDIITQRDLQDYQSRYIDLYQDYSKKDDTEKEKINDDIVFEIELIKQVEVNIDYILMLVAKYYQSNCKDKSILTTIDKSINSSMELRSKKELIENFIESINGELDVNKEWVQFVNMKKEEELNSIITEDKLKEEETKKFVDNSFRNGELKTIGTDIDKILPPMSRFGGARAKKKEKVIERLGQFFEKYFRI
ncbi:type I restriction endonuclease subunit R [Clostridium celatum]|nr:type I restriction endonuclease subunit R [Clostridium celatum]MCE9654127.1 type I restriction endonuclease subunit R [Clostridium celatum]